MNSEERKTRIRSRDHSGMSRRIIGRYFLSLLGLIAAVMSIFFAIMIASQFITWYETSWMYYALRWMRDEALLVGVVIVISGWVIITYHFISKPLTYLDEIIAASGQLARPTEDPIVLPDMMKNVQDELNLVREQALRNMMVAREAEQRKNDLIVYLAHDLKTPLTSVIGYLTLLRDEGEISQQLREKYLSISLEKAERLEDLINEFFEITRFNLSDITLETSTVNLTMMLEQIVYEFRPMLDEKKLECTMKAPRDLMIKCDIDKIQRVFDNLLRNAVNYSFEGGIIEITVSVDENEVEVDFQNHGNTIPKEKLERIFEQFYRLDSARTTKSGGAGLGLAIAKKITELHGGTVTAQSDGEIISFRVKIPIK